MLNKYYCFRIDDWGNRLDKKPGMPRARCQRDALVRYVDGNISRRPRIEFSGYVVMDSPMTPAVMDELTEEELNGLDYDFWVYDKDFMAVGPGETPVYVV